jgi:hypothetical protein
VRNKSSKTSKNASSFSRLFLILSIHKSKTAMAKSQDARKETKKKPAKTLKEKRAEKRDKKANKG